MINDFFDTLYLCLSYLTKKQWIGVIWVSFLLAIICWGICASYTKLWNKRFHIRLKHHILCGLAAILTILFVIYYYGVGNLKNLSVDLVDQWEKDISSDNEWEAETFREAYYAVKEIAPEEFYSVPSPNSRDAWIPLNTLEMQEMFVSVYVDATCETFRLNRPFLNSLLKAKAGISEEVISKDVADYFRDRGDVYPASRAIKLATSYIKDGLIEQAPKTVKKARVILIFLFLLFQLIPFGWIGYEAYNDLHK